VGRYHDIDTINSAIFRVNHQVREEGLAIFYAKNTGIIGDSDHRNYLRGRFQNMLGIMQEEKLQEILAQVHYVKYRTYPGVARHMKNIEIRVDPLFEGSNGIPFPSNTYIFTGFELLFQPLRELVTNPKCVTKGKVTISFW